MSIANLPEDDDTLRLTIVARNFWPQSGATELAVLDLATELKNQGHTVDIITARWKKNWPGSFQIKGIPVTRIVRPNQGTFGSFRFQRQLSRTLSDRPKPDGLIVFGFGDETLSRSRSLRGTPIVVRVDYRNTPYSYWSQLRQKKVFTSLNRATAVAVDSQFSASRISSLGIDANRIHVIQDGVLPPGQIANSTTDQMTARMAISNAHPILSIDPGQPLAVSGAPFDNDGGLFDLVDAWKHVLQVEPKAKLWLLGDGSHGTQIWNKICELDMVYSIIMPGFFDDLQPVFSAADLYIHPLRTARACSYLLRAMNEGLCPIAVESGFSTALVQKNVTGLATGAGKPQALAEAILHGLNNRSLRRRLGNAAGQLVAKSHSIEEQGKKYVQLIKPHPQSVEASLP